MRRLFKLVVLIGLTLGLGLPLAFSSMHSFTTEALEQGIKEKTNLTPSDKFSVQAGGATALVEYKGVIALPETNDYAIVIHVKRW